jgi:hypothetical protein
MKGIGKRDGSRDKRSWGYSNFIVVPCMLIEVAGSYLVFEAAEQEQELSVSVPGMARPPQPAAESEVPSIARVVMK